MTVNIYSNESILKGKEETKMEKKVYETPVVTKVEYDASDRITASGCSDNSSGGGPGSFSFCNLD